MTKMLTFQIDFYAFHADSFRQLMRHSGHERPADLLLEALAIHHFYKSAVPRPGTSGKDKIDMVVFKTRKTLESVDDQISSDHALVETLNVGFPASCFEGVDREEDIKLVSETSRHALILFDHIVAARARKMKIGLYNHTTSELAEINLKAVLPDIESDDDEPGTGPGPQPGGMKPVLH